MSINTEKNYTNKYSQVLTLFKFNHLSHIDKSKISDNFNSNEKINIIKSFFKQKDKKEKVGLIYSDINFTDKKTKGKTNLNLDVFARKDKQLPVYLIIFLANSLLKYEGYNPVFCLNSTGSIIKTKNYLKSIKKLIKNLEKELNSKEKDLIKSNLLNALKIDKINQFLKPTIDDLTEIEDAILREIIDNFENLNINYSMDNSLIDENQNFIKSIIKIKDKKTGEELGYGGHYTNLIKSVTKKDNFEAFGLTLLLKTKKEKFQFKNVNLFLINFGNRTQYFFINLIYKLAQVNLYADFCFFENKYSVQDEIIKESDTFKKVLICTDSEKLNNEVIFKDLEKNHIKNLKIDNINKSYFK